VKDIADLFSYSCAVFMKFCVLFLAYCNVLVLVIFVYEGKLQV